MPPVLAHTIFQALEFDEAVREAYGFGAQTSGTDAWKGTADVILGNEEWFSGWREAERKCGPYSLALCFACVSDDWLRSDAEDKYYEIIGSPDAWQFNEDYTDSGLKPTNSALRVRDLVDQVTGTLPLSSSLPRSLVAF